MSTDEFANNNHVKLTELQLVESEFGLPLEACYKKAIRFYKDQERSGELAVPYEDRVKLMALSKQVKQGPYSESSESAGWFDFVGSDITKAWQSLGSLNKEEAMASFVFMIDRVCPPFKNFIADAIEPIGRQQLPESSELKELNSQPQVQQPNWEVFEAQRKQIQAALNAQTYHQFSAYAQQQFPQEPEQVCIIYYLL